MIEFRNINFRYAGGTDAGGLVNNAFWVLA